MWGGWRARGSRGSCRRGSRRFHGPERLSGPSEGDSRGPEGPGRHGALRRRPAGWGLRAGPQSPSRMRNPSAGWPVELAAVTPAGAVGRPGRVLAQPRERLGAEEEDDLHDACDGGDRSGASEERGVGRSPWLSRMLTTATCMHRRVGSTLREHASDEGIASRSSGWRAREFHHDSRGSTPVSALGGARAPRGRVR